MLNLLSGDCAGCFGTSALLLSSRIVLLPPSSVKQNRQDQKPTRQGLAGLNSAPDHRRAQWHGCEKAVFHSATLGVKSSQPRDGEEASDATDRNGRQSGTGAGLPWMI